MNKLIWSNNPQRLSLWPCWSFSRFLETRLFSFFNSWISLEQTIRLQGYSKLSIVQNQCSCKSKSDGIRLSSDTSPTKRDLCIKLRKILTTKSRKRSECIIKKIKIPTKVLFEWSCLSIRRLYCEVPCSLGKEFNDSSSFFSSPYRIVIFLVCHYLYRVTGLKWS